MPVTAVCFDVFDTLVENTPRIWLGSFEAICREQRLPIDPAVLLERWYVPERQFRKRRLDLRTMALQEPFETYAQVWTDCFREVFEAFDLSGDADAATRLCLRDLGRRPAFPEALDVLRGLDGARTLAVVSNADRAFLDPLLDHYGIRTLFAVVVCSQDVEAYKPHPRLFERLLQELGVSADEVLHVGDRQEEDVFGGKRLGFRTVWVNRRGVEPDPDLPVPDYQTDTLLSLPGILTEAGALSASPGGPGGKRGDG